MGRHPFEAQAFTLGSRHLDFRSTIHNLQSTHYNWLRSVLTFVHTQQNLW